MDFIQDDKGSLVFGRCKRGIPNPGALCYMISVLHQLFHLPGLGKYLVTMRNGGATNRHIINSLSDLFIYMDSEDAVVGDGDILSQLIELVYKDREIDINQQRDACEFFLDLISSFKHIPDVENPLNSYIQGDLMHTMQAKESPELVKEFKEKFYFLSLDTLGFLNIHESLRSYTRLISLQYRWKADHPTAETTKQIKLNKTPEHLIFNLNRFRYNIQKKQKIKLNGFFSFPHVLDMTPFMAEGDSATYQLSGVIVHRGTSAYSGHYYSIVRMRNDEDCDIGDEKWILIDDERVEEYDVDNIATDAFGSLVSGEKQCYAEDYDGSDDEADDDVLIQSAKFLLYDKI